MRGVEAFRKAASLITRPRIEHVEVPYEGTSLPGVIVHADPVRGRTGNGPAMLFLDGFDVTKEAAFKKLEGFKLDGVVQKMKCPYLLVHGEGDQQAPFEHARKTIDAAGSRQKELKIFTREEGGYHHCQVDNVSIGTAYMWDWAAGVLRA